MRVRAYEAVVERQQNSLFGQRAATGARIDERIDADRCIAVSAQPRKMRDEILCRNCVAIGIMDVRHAVAHVVIRESMQAGMRRVHGERASQQTNPTTAHAQNLTCSENDAVVWYSLAPS